MTQTAPGSPMFALKSAFRHRELIFEMTKRDVVGRYRGSVMGLAWSFFNPVLMLLAYTFVFGVVFKNRWGMSSSEGHADFAVILFVGMVVHSFFAESVQRAPTVIVSHANYVKKVIFPLEILPVITVGSALFHTLISTAVLLLAAWVVRGGIPTSAITFPLVLLPLVIGTLGLAWLLASLGVFLRDVGQTIAILTMMLMFLSPVFYPSSAVPERVRPLFEANPLTFFIERSRDVLLFGIWPDALALGTQTGGAVLVASFGFWWFQRTRKGFADVL